MAWIVRRGAWLPTLMAIAAIPPWGCACAAQVSNRRLLELEHLPGLVGFWTFGEEAGHPRLSTGTPQPHPLREMGGPIPRLNGGPFSGYSAYLDGRHYFAIDHERAADLNICGPKAQVSVFAVILLDEMRKPVSVAGMWDEGQGEYDDSGARQYALLLNMPGYGGAKQVTPHVSAEGGVTRRADGSLLPWNVDYAATASEVPVGQWVTVGFSYDGEYVKAYLNGRFEPREMNPAKDNREDRYFTSEGPQGKPRGINPYYQGRGIFCYDAKRLAVQKPRGGADFTVGTAYAGGSILKQPLIGRIGALAVFNRAIADAEMKQLHDAARLPALALSME